MNLTLKQQAFVREYLVDLNATAAAIRAGYSKKTARSIGEENLKKPDISEQIKALTKETAHKVELTAEGTLKQIMYQGYSDIRQLFNQDGSLKKITELPAELSAAIQSIEVVAKSQAGGQVEYVHKIRLTDKIRALELLGKYLKMFVDRHEHTGKNGSPLSPEVEDIEERRLARLIAIILVADNYKGER